MMDKMTTMIEIIVNMQEVVLVLCIAEDGEEKKNRLKECTNSITKQM